MNQIFSFIKNIFLAIGSSATPLANALNGVLSIALKFLGIVFKFFEFVLQALQFAVDIIAFLLKSEFFTNNFRVIMAFLVIGLSHNLIIINEEILVTFCFLAALGFLYSNLGDSVTEALNERSEAIRKELSTFLLLKQENLNELYKSEQSFLNTTQNLAILQTYCQDHFVNLDQKQQDALVGLVAQNLHAKLDALQIVTKGLQPTLHAQMNASFREAVLESFTSVDTSSSVNECLTQIQSL